MNDLTYIVRPSSIATTKQAYKTRVKSKLSRLRSKLFQGDKNKLQSTLFENLNFNKSVNKCYNKDLPCMSRSAAIKTSKIVLTVRMRGDGADDVTSTESSLRTRGDGADDTMWAFPAHTLGDGTDGDATGTCIFCDLDVGFLSEEETCDVCDLDICMIDDVSVTSYQDCAFIEEYGSDSVCELEKNVFDDCDISMMTLTRLRTVFSEGGNIDAIMNIRPDANVHDVTYVVRPASMATKKQAYKFRVKSKLRRLRSKLFQGDKKKLQLTLFENLNVDKTVKKSYDKYIHCVSRSAPYQNSKLLLPVRIRGDGADDVTLAELPLRTRGDGAEDDNTWKSPARTHGERTDDDVIGPRSLCDLDEAFLLEDETCDVCDLDISMIDDVSVTSYHDIAFVEEGDSWRRTSLMTLKSP